MKNHESRKYSPADTTEKTAWDNVGSQEQPDNNQYDLLLNREQDIINQIEGLKTKKQMEKIDPAYYWTPGETDVRQQESHSEYHDRQIKELQQQLADIREILYPNPNSPSTDPNQKVRDEVINNSEQQAHTTGKRSLEIMHREDDYKQAEEATMSPYERAERKVREFERQHSMPEEQASQCFSHEHYIVNKLLKSLGRYDDRLGKKTSVFDHAIAKRDRIRTLRELQRYGYYGPQAIDHHSIFDETREDSHTASLYKYPTMQRRYHDFNFIKSIKTDPDHKFRKSMQKALKKAGYNELPTKWNDENFTTYEIHDIAETIMGVSLE